MNAVRSIPKEDADHALAVRSTLQSSLYPGASDASVNMVLAYCRAAGLDPMQKPVHIVPMWDSKAGGMRDVVMPGIGMYRTQASRSGECAGVTEPEFGPMISEKIGGTDVTYPEWCRVTTKRLMRDGKIAEFSAIEYWIENYAVKGGKEKSIAPNAMWFKRPRGQLAKCAQAQSLRMAFPEIGAQPTAEEMEGKELDVNVQVQPTGVQMPKSKSAGKPPVDDTVVDAEFTETPAQPAGELGIFVADNMKRVLTAKLNAAGKDEEYLVGKYGRVDNTNINAVLADLGALAEQQ